VVRKPQVVDAPCEEHTSCDTCRHALPGGVCARYIAEKYRPLTLAEIGDLFGVTRERVRQIEEVALDKVRRWAPGLAEYLVEEPRWQGKDRGEWGRASDRTLQTTFGGKKS
jgi:hypothetical protein